MGNNTPWHSGERGRSFMRKIFQKNRIEMGQTMNVRNRIVLLFIITMSVVCAAFFTAAFGETMIAAGPVWLRAYDPAATIGPGLSVAISQFGGPIFHSERYGLGLSYYLMPYCTQALGYYRERVHLGELLFLVRYPHPVGCCTISPISGVGLAVQKTWRNELIAPAYPIPGGGDLWGDNIYIAANLSVEVQFPVRPRLSAGLGASGAGYLNLLGRRIDAYSGPSLSARLGININLCYKW